MRTLRHTQPRRDLAALIEGIGEGSPIQKELHVADDKKKKTDDDAGSFTPGAGAKERTSEYAPGPRASAGEWDALEGQEYGGESPIVALEVGEVQGPFTFQGGNEIETEQGKAFSSQANDDKGASYRMPIDATFVQAIRRANLGTGDRFFLRRYDDVKKRRGKGKGTTMKVFSIKVVERSGQP